MDLHEASERIDDLHETITRGQFVERVAPPAPGHGARAPRELDQLPWRSSAECLGHDPAYWFPLYDDGSGPPPHPGTYYYAETICAQCPVAEQCLDYALGLKIRHGYWGRTTPKERARILRKRRRAA